MVRLEGAAVGGAERVGQLFVGVGRVGGQGQARKFETTNLSLYVSYFFSSFLHLFYFDSHEGVL